MKNTLIIGISGKAGAGKDTLANAFVKYIERKYPITVMLPHIYSFGDILKNEVHQYTQIPIENFYNRDVKEIYRPLLQWWGTEYRRNPLTGGNNEYWIDGHKAKVCEIAQAWNHTFNIIFVPDVRFDNEAKYVDYLINVVKEDGEYAVNGADHASEAGIDISLVDAEVHIRHNVSVETNYPDTYLEWVLEVAMNEYKNRQ